MNEQRNGQTIQVWFSDPEEFTDELCKDPPSMVKVLRLTKTFKHSEKLPLQNVSVVSTFMRHVWISDHVAVLERVELKSPCGQIHDYGGEDEVTKRVLARAEEIQGKIETTAKSLGIDVRAGIYE